MFNLRVHLYLPICNLLGRRYTQFIDKSIKQAVTGAIFGGFSFQVDSLYVKHCVDTVFCRVYFSTSPKVDFTPVYPLIVMMQSASGCRNKVAHEVFHT